MIRKYRPEYRCDLVEDAEAGYLYYAEDVERVEDECGHLIEERNKLQDLVDELIADNRAVRVKLRAREAQVERLLDKLAAAATKLVRLGREAKARRAWEDLEEEAAL